MNVNGADENGSTALHTACMRGKKEVVQLLLEAGADPNSISVRNESSLSIATNHNHKQVLSFKFSLL